MKPEIILASSSPRRKRILENAGYKFRVIFPNINEKKYYQNGIKETVMKISLEKARSVAQIIKYPAKIVSADVNCNPIVLIIPKIQITSGLNLNFGVSDYSNMAFQGTPMASTRQDATYDLYKAHGQSKVFLIT